MSLKCIVFLYVIKYIIVNDCFVICVGSSLLSKTVDVTSSKNEMLIFGLHSPSDDWLSDPSNESQPNAKKAT